MGEEGFIIVNKENGLTSSGKLLAIPFLLQHRFLILPRSLFHLAWSDWVALPRVRPIWS
jgi:hypothetical protein